MKQWFIIIGLPIVAGLAYEFWAIKNGRKTLTALARAFTWKEPGATAAAVLLLGFLVGTLVGHIWLTPTCN